MIYLVCHSGYLNYGDELIASNWIKFLTLKYPGERIYIDTCVPGTSSLLHGSCGNLIFTDTLWRLASSGAGRGLEYVLSDQIVRDGGPQLELGLEHIKCADIVHLVGGGYLTDYYYPNFAIPRLLQALKRDAGFKLFATGLGLEPLSRESRTILRTIFHNFDAVDFRDAESYATVANGSTKSGITMSIDDAFLSIYEPRPERGPGKLIIIAQQDEIREPVLPFLLNLIDKCPLSNNGVIIPILDKASDGPLASMVRNISGASIEIVDQVDLFEAGLPIGPDDFVFSTRFHGHLMASALGARGICASVRLPYYDIKHRSLISIGSGFDLIGMHDFPFNDYHWHKKSSNFAENCDILRERKMVIANNLYN